MDTRILEEIGLTNSETKVYLALLELGSTSTGKIVEKSGATSSKIYEILDKLIDKGLASFIIKSGVKHFEAAPPARIMDYMKEKEKLFDKQKQELKNILPELEMKTKLALQKSEATIFKGLKGGETAFKHMINSMKPDDEWIGFIVSFTNEKYYNLLTKLHQERASKDLKARIIFNEVHKKIGKPREKIKNTKVKYIFDDSKTPAIVNVAGNITLLNIMSDDVTFFMIENKDIANSFRNQFETLWNQQVNTYEGQERVELAYNSILENTSKNDEVLIFAAKPKTKQGSDFNVSWNRKMKEKAKNVKLLYYGYTKENKERSKKIGALGCETRIIHTDEKLPISTVVAGNTILNSVWGEEPLTFRIESKEVANSLRTNFHMLWNQETRVVKGLDALQAIFEEMLDSGSADFMGARGYFVDRRPKYMEDWKKRALKKGFKMRNIVDPEAKGHKITKFKFAQTKYTLDKEFAALSVFWIYGKKVVISNWAVEPTAVIMENESIYNLYKEQFELLWKKT